MHKFEIDNGHHHVQECSICHLVHDTTTTIELDALPAQSPTQHSRQTSVLTGHRLPTQPLARSPPVTA
ncbi:hypothetical protein [Photobacterium kasasachensis]|uniref:hypothetical protein n=1 Tax=Photobacterium kasasachensis TaxID=2910240 RepID=UPI003D121D3E